MIREIEHAAAAGADRGAGEALRAAPTGR
jgi:hypothetical protein